MKKAIIFIILLAALCAGGYYCYEEGLIDRWFPGFLEKVIPGYEPKEPAGRVSSDAENAVFLDSVSILCGLGSGSGEILRFSGEVEPQETVSYDLDGNRTVGECFVKEGDHVSDGQELFIYDTAEDEQDLAQAEIDLERLQNSHDTSEAEIVELTKQYESEKTPENELELLTAKNDLKQNALDQEAKQKEIDRLKKAIENSSVYCEVDGVVQSINDDGSGSGGGSYAYGGSSSDSAYIKILKTGTYRIKASANEQNINLIRPGMSMLVFSRTDSSLIWHGELSEIDTDKGGEEDQSPFGSSSSGSSNYAFYVELESSDGLMLGQHVYLEEDMGQEYAHDGIWLNDYYFVTDPDGGTYVWAANSRNLLEKRKVELGEEDQELHLHEVVSGLNEDDFICEPQERLEEGLPVNYNERGPGSAENASGMPGEDGGMDLSGSVSFGTDDPSDEEGLFDAEDFFSGDGLIDGEDHFYDDDGFFDGDLILEEETEPGGTPFVSDAGMPSYEGDLLLSPDSSGLPLGNQGLVFADGSSGSAEGLSAGSTEEEEQVESTPLTDFVSEAGRKASALIDLEG